MFISILKQFLSYHQAQVERVIEMSRARQKELWGVSIGYNLRFPSLSSLSFCHFDYQASQSSSTFNFRIQPAVSITIIKPVSYCYYDDHSVIFIKFIININDQ